MKVLRFIAMFIAIFSFISCEEVKDLVDIDFDKQLTINLPIALNQADSGSTSIEVSLTTDSEIDKYINFLENITINSFEVSVTSYSGDEATYNLQVTTDDDVIFSRNSINIKEIYNNNEVLNISDKNTLTGISKKLLQNKKIMIGCDAENVSGTEITAFFNICCVIQMTITANPL